MQPLQQATLERSGGQLLEDPLEGIMRRNPIGQGQKRLEPVPPFASKGFDLLPVVGPGEDGTQGDGDEVQQQVPFAPVQARVFSGERSSTG